MLGRDELLADGVAGGLHHPARAKRVVQLFMSGAASQCDTFDYKPRLVRDHGKPWDPGEAVELFQSTPGQTMMTPWKWRRYGGSGKWINDCVAPLGACVDDIAFVHNMVGKSNVHGPATFLQATGFILPGFPSVGAWVSYGLGSLNDDLPTFVVLPDPRGYRPERPEELGRRLPAGRAPGDRHPPRRRRADRRPLPARRTASSTPPPSPTTLAALEAAQPPPRRGPPRRLAARGPHPQLRAGRADAARAPRRSSTSPASRNTSRELYGLDAPDATTDGPMNEGEEIRHFGRNCLVARRLLERGVRFVQIWSGADNGFPRRNWDSHEDLARDHWPLGRGMARGASALIQDLKQRGLLDDTIVLWTTEFGRMPCSQGSLGRDHNPCVFTNWLAGGGIKGGTTYGESDEWSYKPARPRPPDLLLRRPRHDPAPARDRPQAADRPPRRHRPPPDRRPRPRHRRTSGVSAGAWKISFS